MATKSGKETIGGDDAANRKARGKWAILREQWRPATRTLLAALIHWGTQKVLFRIRERERLIERIIELEARDAEKTSRIAELEARDKASERLVERIAELENQKAQQNENESQ